MANEAVVVEFACSEQEAAECTHWRKGLCARYSVTCDPNRKENNESDGHTAKDKQSD